METPIFSDNYFMREALREAEKALEKDEVPVGAVIVSNNIITARAHNLTETLNDTTAHAEMQAFTSAASYLGGNTWMIALSTLPLNPATCAPARHTGQG